MTGGYPRLTGADGLEVATRPLPVVATDANRCWYTRSSWKPDATVRCLLVPHHAWLGHLIDEVGGQRTREWPECEWDVTPASDLGRSA